jgi:ribosomal protein S18 acetylase RimI-like enzyme
MVTFLDRENLLHQETIKPAVIKLDPSQQRLASQLLARAFFDEPLMVHYLPEPTIRLQALPIFMWIPLRYCLAYGEVWTNSALEGVACWLPPGKTKMDAWGIIRASLGVFPIRLLLPVLRGAGPDGLAAVPLQRKWQFLKKLQQTEKEIERIHEETAPGPHWYLMTLGVDPGRQGQGIGSRLIAPMLQRARSMGVPCYLETMTELDVAFYRKNGFEVNGELDLVPGEVHLWAMTWS